jgi:DMSO/TMAO reductase YedYZ heme-binding membrane subunit
VDGNKTPTPAELTILIAGGVMVIASFLDFAGDTSTWGSYVFPLATLLPLYGAVMAFQIGLTAIGGLRMRARVLGFTWEQVHLLLGLFAGAMAVGWLLTDVTRKGLGFWLEVAGGIALAVGAVRLQRERHTGAIG